MNKLRVISDGTPQGTQVLLPDGTDISKHACRIDIVIVPDDLVKVMLTYPMVPLDMHGDAALETEEQEPVRDPIALHNARKL